MYIESKSFCAPYVGLETSVENFFGAWRQEQQLLLDLDRHKIWTHLTVYTQPVASQN